MNAAVDSPGWRFGRFDLQPFERQLLVDGQPVSLRPMTFDVLKVLIEARGRLVTKKDLQQRVWGKVMVEDNALQAHISALRKVLGNGAIATIPGSGYRFTLAVNSAAREFENNLPLLLTNFIGREREIAEVGQWLRSTRLLTLVGTGGCGKTRLAVEVARAAGTAFAHGVWFVELAAIRDPSMLTGVIARALPMQTEPGVHLLTAVLQWLETRQLLIVLDNAEHLVDACAELAHHMLRRCAGLVILVTSRERLAIDGERTYPISSMSVPLDSSPEAVLASEAARMFIDRARLHRPEFEVVGPDVDALGSVCRRLDGIALAIELAVPPIRVMSLRSLSEKLDERFTLLTAGSRVALPRHRTLRSMIDWSHDLLSAPQQMMFSRLGVFVGGCTIGFARQVCSGNGIAPEDVQPLMTSLVEKSLLTVSVDPVEVRFDMLETVRHYALERLRASGEEAVVRGKHLDALYELAKGAQYGVDDTLVIPRLAQLGREHDNVNAALGWSESQPALATKGLDFAGALNRFWRYGGAFEEGRHWLERLMKAAPADAPGEIQAQALHAAGALAYAQGDFGVAVDQYLQAIDQWRLLRNRQRLVLSLGALGEVERARSDRVESMKHFEEALCIARRLPDLRAVALLLGDLARLALDAGDYGTAEARLADGMSLGRTPGLDPAASLLSVLGELRHEQGDLEGARQALEEAIEIRRQIGHRPALAEDLLRLAEVWHDLRDNAQARLCSLAALDLQPSTRQALADWLDSFAALCVDIDGAFAAARLWGCAQRHQEGGSKRNHVRTRRLSRAARDASRSAEEFDRAWAEGRSWSIEHGVATAREHLRAAASRGTSFLPGSSVAPSTGLGVRSPPGFSSARRVKDPAIPRPRRNTDIR